jgi:hypothetical protein
LSNEHGEDEDFEVFRKVVVKPSKDQPEKPGAILIVRFSFASLAAKTNRFLSLIPIPFIVAQQGFRSKTWMMGQKTGAFQGLYGEILDVFPDEANEEASSSGNP